MKKVFIACLFGMLCINIANAQSVTVEPKTMLTSKVNEFDAHLSRGNTVEAGKIFPDVMALMSQRIAALHNEVKTATGEQKETLTKKLDAQQKAYSDAKMLSSDVSKNSKEIDVKFKKFLENY